MSCEALRAEVEKLKDPWTSIEKSLPPLNTVFDAWTNRNERLADHGAYAGSWDDDFRYRTMKVRGITHWMIPVAPNREQQ
jgi:hypothetical protein